MLEDNLRIPSGASYPLVARSITRRLVADAYAANGARDDHDYPELLAAAMAYSSRSGIPVILTPGNGVADDRGIYYFVPAMASYYLGEEPILRNAPTYLPMFPHDMAYVMKHLDLV